jgi:hypothetical protein
MKAKAAFFFVLRFEWFQNFGKSLVRMFKDKEEDCVFFEYFTGTKSRSGFPHLTIECVPLPNELGDQAPIYFKVRSQLPRIYSFLLFLS